MKIQLQSLRVVNCGPLDNVCIQFNTNGDSPVTVLAGANGSGKTTVLKLIVELAELLNKIRLGATPSRTLLHCEYAQMDWLIDHVPVTIAYGKQPDDAALASDYHIEGSDSNDTPIRSIMKLGGIKTHLDRLIDAIQLQKNSAINLATSQIPNSYDNLTAPSILFFPFTRFMLPVQGQHVQREETKYQWVYQYNVSNTYAGSLDSYLIWLEYAKPEIYAQAIEYLNSLNFEGKKFGVQREELRAIVTTKDGHIHGVAELSSGEQNILIMLLELRRRLLPGSIVLIDEIENSLHLAFQHQLGQGLKRLQEQIPFQLIVTTHSSEFVRIFGPGTARILTEF